MTRVNTITQAHSDLVALLKKFHFSKPDVINGSVRILNAFVSATLILYYGRILGILEFSVFQVTFVFAGLIVWLGDLGTSSLMTNLLGQNSRELLREVWTLRLSTIFLFSLIAIMASDLFDLGLSAILFTAFIVDFIVDSNLSLRFLLRTSWSVALIQFFRRFSQGLGVIFCFEMLNFPPFEAIGLSILVPSMVVLILDSVKFGMKASIKQIKLLKRSFRFWVQSASVQIANSDTFILKSVGAVEVISLLGIVRKFLFVSSIPMSVASPQIQHSAAKEDQDHQIRLQRFSASLILTIMFTMLSILLIPIICSDIFEIEITSEQFIFFTLLLVSGPFQAKIVEMNAINFGQSKLRVSTIAAYVSQCSYIVLVLVCCIFFKNLYVLLGAAYLFKTVFEYWILITWRRNK